MSGTAVPGSLYEGAAERSEAEGVYPDARKRSKISESKRPCINHRPGATIGRHSLSQSFGLPAPSEREPGGLVPSIRVLAKIPGYGRFSSPLRNYTLPFIGGAPPQRGSRERLSPSIRVLANIRGCGRFSSPLRNYAFPFIGEHPLREGAGDRLRLSQNARISFPSPSRFRRRRQRLPRLRPPLWSPPGCLPVWK